MIDHDGDGVRRAVLAGAGLMASCSTGGSAMPRGKVLTRPELPFTATI
jgi:hypothetical protein